MRRRRAGHVGGVADASVLETIDVARRTIAHEVESVRRKAELGLMTDGAFRVNAEYLYRRLAHIVGTKGVERAVRDVLRTYQLPSKERTKLERIAKFWFRSSIRIARGDGEKAYRTLLEDTAEHLRFLEHAIAIGKPCGDDDVCHASCFKVVNAGGFDRAKLEGAAAVVNEAVRLLRAHGFESLCYGDINITNNIANQSNVLAFYDVRTDEIFVRANLKGKEQAALQTFLHEIGHRYEAKFASSTQRLEIDRLYARYKREVRGEVIGDFPPIVPGEHFEHRSKPTSKKVTHFVVVTAGGLAGDKVLLALAEDPSRRVVASIGRDAYYAVKYGAQVSVRPFPSRYAMSKPSNSKLSELFAELFSFYCMGALDASQKKDFERLVGRG